MREEMGKEEWSGKEGGREGGGGGGGREREIFFTENINHFRKLILHL